MPIIDELYELSAAQVKQLIQDRAVSVEEVTRAYLTRIETYDQPAGLNAVAEINETAIDQARKLDAATSGRDSLLFGLPILVKDNIDVQGLHTTAGSLALADHLAGRNTLQEIIVFYEASPAERMPYGISWLQAAVESSVDDAAYLEAIRQRGILRAQTLRDLSRYDACVMTGPTNIMHFVGLPSLALNFGMDGMPCGVILYGADERRLMAAALTIEAYCPPVAAPVL